MPITHALGPIYSPSVNLSCSPGLPLSFATSERAGMLVPLVLRPYEMTMHQLARRDACLFFNNEVPSMARLVPVKATAGKAMPHPFSGVCAQAAARCPWA